MTKYIQIAPQDTLFFRDGRPFNQDDEGLASAMSGSFPPSPRTVAMMVRAALATGQGWPGGDWSAQNWQGKPQDFVDVVGNGSTDLGRLRFKPPRLLLDDTLLYPVPLSLVRNKNGEDYALLVPGVERQTDLGKARLPVVDAGGEGWQTMEGYFVAESGLKAILGGSLPCTDDIFPPEELSVRERRIGLERNRSNRVAEDGKLYSIVHIRAQSGLSLLSAVDGVDDWQFSTVQPLGGEGRFAWLNLYESKKISMPTVRIKARSGKVHFSVTAISPVRMADDGWRTPGGKIAGLPGIVVSACVGKTQMIGGFSSVAKSFGPQPLTPYLPAGSVWFLEADENEFDQGQLPPSIGKETEFGYGGCVFGVWNEKRGH